MRSSIGISALVVFFLILMIPANSARAAIFWVGNSTACDGVSASPSLAAALFGASLTIANDEIRLTRTITYSGNGLEAVLTDWTAGALGTLTISGGYDDCLSGKSGRTTITGGTSDLFEVTTATQATSQVTFTDLEITGAGGRAIVAKNASEVTLDNVWIHHNGAGVSAWSGSYIDMKATTSIDDNGSLPGPWGGGIYCTGSNSEVSVRGTLSRNSGSQGGNIFLSNGCFVELYAGVEIEGTGSSGATQAEKGGGVFVDQGGELFASGSDPRVIIHDNKADDGGGLYVNGSGTATLLNTAMWGNTASTGNGAAIYAIDGGSASRQVLMDRVATCPFTFFCSVIESSKFISSVIFTENSHVEINHTAIRLNDDEANTNSLSSAIIRIEGGTTEVRLSSSLITSSKTKNIFILAGGKIIATHVTIANNSGTFDAQVLDSFLGRVNGTLDIQNSIMVDTRGLDFVIDPNKVFGKCNLVNDGTNMPPSMYDIGVPLFTASFGQLHNSPGVDMCQQDYFLFSNDFDIANAARPVNENLNPEGNPGEALGLYDAGAFELYRNVVPDTFSLNVTIAGTGSGTVASDNIAGINCPGDCSHVYSSGTSVELIAYPTAGHSVSWSGCNIVENDTNCTTLVDQNRNPSATFTGQPLEDDVFKDGFESLP